MRLFAAIPLPDEVLNSLEAEAKTLRVSGLQARWVHRNNMHLTLRFYGDVTSDLAASLKSALTTHLSQCEAALLQVRGLGAFPSLRRPAVFWAGVQTMTGDLAGIQWATELAARYSGLPPEPRRFHPHITVARFGRAGKGTKPPGVACILDCSADTPVFGRAFRASSVVLFSSTLTSSGPIYHVVREITLK